MSTETVEPAKASTPAAAPTGIAALGEAAPAKTDPVTPAEPKTPAVETPATPPAAPVEPAKVPDPAKPEEPKATEAKPATGEPAKVETELTVKLPDGAVAGEALLGEFVPLAKELGLDSAKAQKLIDLYAQQQTKQLEAEQKSWADEQRKHVEAITSDAEMGGTKLEATRKSAQLALRTFNPKLAARMEALGLGSDPEFIRFCSRVGVALGDDSVAGTSGSNAPAPLNPDEALARGLYTTMNPKKE
jgi:hypothetical protein